MLPIGQRQAIVLVGAVGMSYAEAAAMLSVPLGTLKSRVSRARAALGAILESGELIHDQAPAELAALSIFRDAASWTAAAEIRGAWP